METDSKLTEISADCVIVVRIEMPGSQESLNTVPSAELKYCKNNS